MKIHASLKLNKANRFQYRWGKYILWFLLAFATSPASFAKEGPAWRRFLNFFHLNLSSGYGVNFYENTIAGMYMYKQDGKYYLAASGGLAGHMFV
jgi:hypothetical protein